jgi:RNA polymerase sigma-B factor
VAVRYADRGEPLDDLIQVACVGMMKAIDGFDLTRAVRFSSYATPTVLGEIKRHFRDRTWALRVPRGLQELEDVLAAMQTAGVRRTRSLDEPSSEDITFADSSPCPWCR